MTTTLIPIICGLVAALAVVALTPLAAHLARAVGAVAEPKGRSIHSTPTPLLGGLAILAGFLIPVIYYLPTFDTPAKALIVGGILIALLGAVDDVVDLSPAVKLIGQAACAVIPVAAGLTIDHLTLPFVGVGDLGAAGELLVPRRSPPSHPRPSEGGENDSTARNPRADGTSWWCTAPPSGAVRCVLDAPGADARLARSGRWSRPAADSQK